MLKNAFFGLFFLKWGFYIDLVKLRKSIWSTFENLPPRENPKILDLPLVEIVKKCNFFKAVMERLKAVSFLNLSYICFLALFLSSFFVIFQIALSLIICSCLR